MRSVVTKTALSANREAASARYPFLATCSASCGRLAFAMRSSLHLPNTPSAKQPRFLQIIRKGVGKRMAMAWLLGVFKLGTYWTCYTWLPSFLLNKMHQGVGRSVTWVLTAQIGQFVGMLTFGVVSASALITGISADASISTVNGDVE